MQPLHPWTCQVGGRYIELIRYLNAPAVTLVKVSFLGSYMYMHLSTNCGNLGQGLVGQT